MDHADDANNLAVHVEEDAVWKSLEDGPADVAMQDGKRLTTMGNLVYRLDEMLAKSSAESRPACS